MYSDIFETQREHHAEMGFKDPAMVIGDTYREKKAARRIRHGFLPRISPEEVRRQLSACRVGA